MTEDSSLAVPASAPQLQLPRPPGDGWLVLLGGGDFSYGDTFDADLAWLAKVPPGAVGFLPTASGSVEYHRQLAEYFDDELGRDLELIPIYRGRDVRRRPSLERLAKVPTVYLGGGVSDILLKTLRDTPALDALRQRLADGLPVVAMAAAAQALGSWVRDVTGRETLPGFGWLRGGVVEANFDPGHDRRVRQLLRQPGARWALGLPAGTAALVAPNGGVEVCGEVFYLDDPEGDFQVFEQAPFDGDLPPLPLDPREG